jgi:hypothetical protein
MLAARVPLAQVGQRDAPGSAGTSHGRGQRRQSPRALVHSWADGHGPFHRRVGEVGTSRHDHRHVARARRGHAAR